MAIPGINDNAFGGGALTLSLVGQRPFETGCKECKKGTISAGQASNDHEQDIIAAKLGAPGPWSFPTDIQSTLVFRCGDRTKHMCAQSILDWYLSEQNVKIEPGDVYFFDDSAVNIADFGKIGMNAHQVSCASRDGKHGLCGATPEEVTLTKGTSFCR